MKTIYCGKCRCEQEYHIVENVNYEMEYENILIKYVGKKAVCTHCGEELFVEEVEKYNQIAFEEAYKQQLEIINTGQIDEILKKYNIKKRPLSLLLGWGETTLSRYYQDYIPSSKNSKVLKTILKSPEEYYKYLLSNSDKITSAAYKKTKEETEKLLGIDENTVSVKDENIINVSNYIAKQIEVTPLGLQKLLYYIQVFFLGFYKKAAFSSKCSAWEHGPVFGKVYYEYKQFKSNVIEISDKNEVVLEESLKEVVDNVIKYFGIYSAKTLEWFTHSESPWFDAYVIGNRNINKSELRKFGELIIKENQINSVDEIYKYSLLKHKKYIDDMKTN